MKLYPMSAKQKNGMLYHSTSFSLIALVVFLHFRLSILLAFKIILIFV